MKLARLSPRVISLLCVVCPLAAIAHTGVDAGLHHGFAAGFVHPLQGADHLIAMVTVGLWSSLTARRRVDLLVAPAAFALMMWAGALLGLAGVHLPDVESWIAVSVLVLGLLAMTQQRLAAPIAALLVGLFAVFHGHAHGWELAGEPNAAFAIAGMLVASLLLHALGIGFGTVLRRVPPWFARLAGLLVVALGAAMLGVR